MRNPIYLDNNSTTPIDKNVLEEMMPYLTTKFGNASSKQHSYGWISEDAVLQSKERILKLLGGTTEDEFIFTSGATESINLVLRGLAAQNNFQNKQVITCKTEHSAVLETLGELERSGVKVNYLPVGSNGILDLNVLQEALKIDTALVCMMIANNETGVLQPIREITSMAHKHGALLFTDASQAFGKIQIDIQDLEIDLLACSAHKIYGPKGVGGLFIKNRKPKIKLKSQITGGGQQQNLRSGTLNVPGIVGFGKAAEIAGKLMPEESKNLSFLRNKLENSLLQIPFSNLNGDLKNRLPHVTNLRFDFILAHQLLNKVPDIAFSTGSACNSETSEPSHVLLSMGLTEKEVKSSFRLALGRMNTLEEIEYSAMHISNFIDVLRTSNPIWKKAV